MPKVGFFQKDVKTDKSLKRLIKEKEGKQKTLG